jgi:hypothetical protein
MREEIKLSLLKYYNLALLHLIAIQSKLNNDFFVRSLLGSGKPPIQFIFKPSATVTPMEWLGQDWLMKGHFE